MMAWLLTLGLAAFLWVLYLLIVWVLDEQESGWEE